MSQTETVKAMAAEERTEETRSFIRRLGTVARRKDTAEDKIRIRLGSVPPGGCRNRAVPHGEYQGPFLLCMD